MRDAFTINIAVGVLKLNCSSMKVDFGKGITLKK